MYGSITHKHAFTEESHLLLLIVAVGVNAPAVHFVVLVLTSAFALLCQFPTGVLYMYTGGISALSNSCTFEHSSRVQLYS